MKFNVFNGAYPFDIKLGEVYAETPEYALATAIAEFRTVDHPHPVVAAATASEESDDGHRAYH